MNAVQPGTESDLEKQFGQLQSVELSLSGCRITVQQARATADCAEHFTAQLKVGGRRQDDTRRRQFTLDKSSGAWRITSARIAQVIASRLLPTPDSRLPTPDSRVSQKV